MISTTSQLFKRPIFWLCVCLVASLAVIGYPIYVIRPFRYQGSHELQAALAVISITPFLEIVFVLAALTLLIICWRQSRGWLYKLVAVVSALLVILFAVLSRVNVYELMFHPLDNPTFSAASKAKLDGNEEVIAIHVGTAARAYPVRSMSYHHIVNDTLAGFPVVATY